MAKAKFKNGLAYSTDDGMKEDADNPFANLFSDVKSPEKQRLHVFYEAKGRSGKPVTIVAGFEGPSQELEALAKRLKTTVGVGGTAKEGEILIQGDQQQKVKDALKAWGYALKGK